MATQRKNTGPVKERKGISASIAKSRSNSAPIAGSLNDKSISHPTDKRPPNYLKPTASSGPELSPHGKKQASHNTTQQHSLNRRSSLDKAPSTSHPPKAHAALHSPEKDLRSSSNIKKSSSLPKLQAGRSSRASKEAGKSHLSHAKPNNVTKTTKGEKSAPSSAASTPRSVSPDPPDSLAVELQLENHEPLIADIEEEIIVVESENQLPNKLATLEDTEQEVETKIENSENEDPKPSEASAVLEEEKESLGSKVEEPEHEVLVEETDNNSEKEEDTIKDESPITQPEESCLDGPKVGLDDNDGDKVDFEDQDGIKVVEDEDGDKVDVGNKDGEEGEIKTSSEHASADQEETREGNNTPSNKIEKEDVGEENKPEFKNVTTAHQGGQEKKECQAYNDVIEETASKLMEKRRNKVKALVGAFETVISLQEPEG